MVVRNVKCNVFHYLSSFSVIVICNLLCFQYMGRPYERSISSLGTTCHTTQCILLCLYGVVQLTCDKIDETDSNVFSKQLNNSITRNRYGLKNDMLRLVMSVQTAWSKYPSVGWPQACLVLFYETTVLLYQIHRSREI